MRQFAGKTRCAGIHGLVHGGGYLECEEEEFAVICGVPVDHYIFDSTFDVRYSAVVAMSEKYDENMSDRYEK